MISYAQNFEDVLLERLFQNVASGFYVDVGANDPTVDSVTRHFYNRGWHGINVEPSIVFHRLERDRPRDINLHLAASDHSGVASFYENPAALGTSTLSASLPDSVQEVESGRISYEVELKTLAEIFAEHNVEQIEFLSVDVEGHEAAVLRGNDWTRFRPRVLVIESTIPNTNAACHEAWEPMLLNEDYVFAYFDGINRFYVRREDSQLLAGFRLPVNVLDHFVSAETHHLRQLAFKYNRAIAAKIEENADLHRELNEVRSTSLSAPEKSADHASCYSPQNGTAGREYTTANTLKKRTDNPAIANGSAAASNGTSLSPQQHQDDLADHSPDEQLAIVTAQRDNALAELEALAEEVTRLRCEVNELRLRNHSYESDLVHRAGEVQTLRSELHVHHQHLDWVTRRTGSKSLAVGLKVARKLHWLTRQ